ncbi:hypothetical protein CH352_04985 [Leptospira hartskeerlii]|uniref:DUF1554 domain-containing protein n=1 Tax=Leptospira hartskeerlii TaxID=2023177 RepID=A0A2M9XFV8_9LEPT|nr:hypothetical protein CH357_03470 [Leptospira hartskeerlii]PJZ34949.1 hypothetical protein CH352_04985 [Leptospira hartskeerlii]
MCSSFYYNCLGDKTCSDEDKSCSTQALLTSALTVPNGIYIYSTLTTYQGNLAAFDSTPEISGQNICRGEKLFSSLVNQFCPDVWAFISTESVPLSSFATSFSAPINLPVFGPTGLQLASTWDNFTLGSVSLDRPLSDAGLGTDDFWTFAGTPGGGLAANNCNIGSDNTNIVSGATGSAKSKNTDWLNPSAATATCDTRHRVLCVCFTPDSSSAQAQ